MVLAVITDYAVGRAMAVGNEIGYAKKQEVTIIPIVADDVSESQIGCLKGITYERINRDNPGPALERIRDRILHIKRKGAWELAIGIVSIALMIWFGSKKG